MKIEQADVADRSMQVGKLQFRTTYAVPRFRSQQHLVSTQRDGVNGPFSLPKLQKQKTCIVLANKMHQSGTDILSVHSADTNIDALYEHMTGPRQKGGWGLKTPLLLLCVTGSAGEALNLRPCYKDTLIYGLVSMLR
jgi:hypothetical protein